MLTELDLVEGMQFDRGYISAYMATDMDKMVAILEEPMIMITDKKISNIQEILPILEQVMQMGRKLLLIAEDVESEVLATLVVNKLRNIFTCVAVKAPSFGDRKIQLLKDIACITGATFVSTTKGDDLNNLGIDGLGKCAKAIINQNKTVIIEVNSETDFVAKNPEFTGLVDLIATAILIF